MKLIVTSILLVILTNSIHAQVTINESRWEFGTDFYYHYKGNHSTAPTWPNLELNEDDFLVLIESVASYRISNYFSVQAGLLYGRTIHYFPMISTLSSRPLEVFRYIYRYHDVGLLTDLNFDLPINLYITLFMNPRIAIIWSRNYQTSHENFALDDLGWGPVSTTLPTIDAGIRVHCLSHWAISGQVMLSKKHPFHVVDNSKIVGTFYAWGIGFYYSL